MLSASLVFDASSVPCVFRASAGFGSAAQPVRLTWPGLCDCWATPGCVHSCRASVHGTPSEWPARAVCSEVDDRDDRLGSCPSKARAHAHSSEVRDRCGMDAARTEIPFATRYAQRGEVSSSVGPITHLIIGVVQVCRVFAAENMEVMGILIIRGREITKMQKDSWLTKSRTGKRGDLHCHSLKPGERKRHPTACLYSKWKHMSTSGLNIHTGRQETARAANLLQHNTAHET